MDLINDRNWSHDQALHEMTHMRSELTTYLQPRARVAKPNPVPDKGTFKGPPFKGGGKHQKEGRASPSRTQKEKAKARRLGSPTSISTGNGNHYAFDINQASATSKIAGSFMRVPIRSLTAQLAGVSTRRWNMHPRKLSSTDDRAFIILVRRGKGKILLQKKFCTLKNPKKYFVEFLTPQLFVKLHFFADLHCDLLCD